MSENWFHAAQGSALGPFGRAHILELIASGEIGPQTLVWRKGLTDWQPAATEFTFPAHDAAPAAEAPAPRDVAQDEARGEIGARYLEPPRPATQDWVARARAAAPAAQPEAPWSAAAATAAPASHAADRVPMDPLTAIRRVYARYFTFRGRASRGEFWWFTLFYTIVLIVLTLVDFRLIDSPYTPLSALFMLFNFFPLYTVSTRRLHDTGNSGWWIVAQLVAPMVLMAVAGVAFFQQLYALDTTGDAATPDGFLQGLLGSLLAYVLSGLTSLVLSIIILVMLGRRGDLRENRYGPPPP